MIRLLIDECLTPGLVEVARARWIEADHITWLGRAGAREQIALFRKVLDYIEAQSDIVNQLIEIDRDGRLTATPWSATDA